MNTVKQYIKDVLNTFDPSLDTSDSSAITDLLINPGSAMLDPVIAQINYIIANLNLNSPESLSSDELDAIASNYLVTRSLGSKASGYVELFYNSPTNVEITPETIFSTATGLQFVAIRQMSISSSAMSQNVWAFPRYSTGPIPVEAAGEGLIYCIVPGEITSSTVTPIPSRVTNVAGFSGGTDTETNSEFAERFIASIISGSLSSPKSIMVSLQNSFPSIKDVMVKGMEDSQMLRDLVTDGINLYSLYSDIDFYGKINGYDTNPYPESQAYWSLFYDDPGTSGLLPDLPEPGIFTEEFTDDYYLGIYNLNADGTNVRTSVLFSDDFSGTEFDSRWRFGDSRAGSTTLINSSEITIDNNKVKLGVNHTEADIPNMSISVPVRTMFDIINGVRRLPSYPSYVSEGLNSLTTYADVQTLRTALEELLYGPGGNY
jgi:hypothetical protein